MTFCTAINCMDGRVQIPVINYLRKRCGAKYVDSVTEAGPNGVLAGETNLAAIASIMDRVRISVHQHESRKIAVVGHHDCAGNPMGREFQDRQTRAAVKMVKSRFPECEVFGLWVDERWNVRELPAED
ncbi:MAG: hypothetical protein JSV91_06375 [Phycisphaerales bacterium]|nr:MAG: hypothetical protein JSV91_06375 [Phycisphaerales bacterium]